MLINQVCTLTGMEQKVSQKTGNEYFMYNFLNPDGDGTTFGCYSTTKFQVTPLTSYDVVFNLKLGRYLGLEVRDISPIEVD